MCDPIMKFGSFESKGPHRFWYTYAGLKKFSDIVIQTVRIAIENGEARSYTNWCDQTGYPTNTWRPFYLLNPEQFKAVPESLWTPKTFTIPKLETIWEWGEQGLLKKEDGSSYAYAELLSVLVGMEEVPKLKDAEYPSNPASKSATEHPFAEAIALLRKVIGDIDIEDVRESLPEIEDLLKGERPERARLMYVAWVFGSDQSFLEKLTIAYGYPLEAKKPAKGKGQAYDGNGKGSSNSDRNNNDVKPCAGA
ncbi:MAG: hypothetical protein AAGA75_18645 [Cyanobacteria bacterium P01_E01_bin.6]